MRPSSVELRFGWVLRRAAQSFRCGQHIFRDTAGRVHPFTRHLGSAIR